MEIIQVKCCGYKEFMSDVIDYVILNYGEYININILKKVDIVNKDILGYSDGKITNEYTIALSTRPFELLPSLILAELKNNEDFICLVNTVVHELCHLMDRHAMPKLYENVFAETINKNMLVSLFWLEYLAESKSSKLVTRSHDEFCLEFVEANWNITKCSKSPDQNNYNNFFWLNKHLPYFIARAITNGRLSEYLSLVKTPHLKEFILDLINELQRLEQLIPFDDVSYLNNLYNLQNKYYRIYLVK